MGLSGYRARNRRPSAKPSNLPGMWMSVTSASKPDVVCSRTDARSPLAAAVTSYPVSCRSSTTMKRISSSSSTTRRRATSSHHEATRIDRRFGEARRAVTRATGCVLDGVAATPDRADDGLQTGPSELLADLADEHVDDLHLGFVK